MLLAELAEVSRRCGYAGRLGKIDALSAALRSATPEEAPVVVAYLSGELPQRQIGVGWAALRSAPPPAATPSLTVGDVDEAFSRIGAQSGKGSAAERSGSSGRCWAPRPTVSSTSSCGCCPGNCAGRARRGDDRGRGAGR